METQYVLAFCFLSFLAGVLTWMIMSDVMDHLIEKKYPRGK